MKAMLVVVVLILSFGAAGPTTSEESSNIHFTTVDVQIDPRGNTLAAYQVEFIADSTRVKLVGIEGGDHTAFKQPPYYDPAALSHNRVIVAAFNAGRDLPSATFRAARLHLEITGSEKPRWEAKLMVAAATDGPAIAGAAVSLSEGAEK